MNPALFRADPVLVVLTLVYKNVTVYKHEKRVLCNVIIFMQQCNYYKNGKNQTRGKAKVSNCN